MESIRVVDLHPPADLAQSSLEAATRRAMECQPSGTVLEISLRVNIQEYFDAVRLLEVYAKMPPEAMKSPLDALLRMCDLTREHGAEKGRWELRIGNVIVVSRGVS